jgi:hypothetical protein
MGIALIVHLTRGVTDTRVKSPQEEKAGSITVSTSTKINGSLNEEFS